MDSKKSQITAYLVIGVVMIILAALVYILFASLQERPIDIIRRDSIAVEPQAIKNYVETCIYEEAKPLIYEIAKKGGTLWPDSSYQILYDGTEYTYACLFEPGHGCVNRLYTRKLMEQNIETALEDAGSIKKCVSFDPFIEQAYEVKAGALKVDVRIGTDDVHIDLSYPLKFTKAEFVLDIEDFSANLLIPLGKMVDLSTKIVNNETDDNYFDKDAWMRQTGEEIMIEKHKPYPDIVYKLKKDYSENDPPLIYNFAMQGESTVGLIGKKSTPVAKYGYCIFSDDRTCYFNTKSDECRDAEGDFRGNRPDPELCRGLTDFTDSGCEGGPCQGCTDNQGAIRLHGESWCEYDNIVRYGADYVGSRHYQRSCINGKLYYEECRDYREELCAEGFDSDLNLGQGVCRPNRWQLCSKQTNEGSCMSAGDCYWGGELVKSDGKVKKCEYAIDWNWVPNKFLYEDNAAGEPLRPYETRRCHPSTPPGFKFWESQGLEVCAMANEMIDADLESDRASIVDSNALYCYSLGDCGAWRNVADQLDEKAYINTDAFIGDPVRDEVYVFQGLWRGYSHAENRVMQTGPIERWPLQLTGNEFTDYEDNINNVMGYWSDYWKCVWSEFDRDNIEKVAEEEACCNWRCSCEVFQHHWVRHISICMPWQAPDPVAVPDSPFKPPQRENPVPKCGFCNTDALVTGNNKPCTEYKCMSLGSNCVYEKDADGNGICREADLLDHTKPVIDFGEVETPGIEISSPHTLVSGQGGGRSYRGVFLCNGECVDDLNSAVMDGLEPYSKIKFNITSVNEETKCKISYFPVTDYRSYSPIFNSLFLNRIPKTQTADYSMYLGGEFKQNHTVEITVFPNDKVYKQLSDLFQTDIPLGMAQFDRIDRLLYDVTIGYAVSSMERALREFGHDATLARMATDLRNLWNQYVLVKAQLKDIYQQFGDDIQLVLMENQAKKQALFFNCIDRSGNQNDNFFVEFRIGEDTRPARIIEDGINPAPGSEIPNPNLFGFEILLNEPAECRYILDGDRSYLAIPPENQMDCQTNVLETTGGFYKCSAIASASQTPIGIYIRCRDQPTQYTDYHITLKRQAVFEIVDSVDDTAINLAGNWIEIGDVSVMDNDAPIIGVTTGTVGLRFWLDKESDCRYTIDETQHFDDILNIVGCQADGDRYKCTANLATGAQEQTYTIKCADKNLPSRNEGVDFIQYNP